MLQETRKKPRCIALIVGEDHRTEAKVVTDDATYFLVAERLMSNEPSDVAMEPHFLYFTEKGSTALTDMQATWRSAAALEERYSEPTEGTGAATSTGKTEGTEETEGTTKTRLIDCTDFYTLDDDMGRTDTAYQNLAAGLLGQDNSDNFPKEAKKTWEQNGLSAYEDPLAGNSRYLDDSKLRKLFYDQIAGNILKTDTANSIAEHMKEVEPNKYRSLLIKFCRDIGVPACITDEEILAEIEKLKRETLHDTVTALNLKALNKEWGNVRLLENEPWAHRVAAITAEQAKKYNCLIVICVMGANHMRGGHGIVGEQGMQGQYKMYDGVPLLLLTTAQFDNVYETANVGTTIVERSYDYMPNPALTEFEARNKWGSQEHKELVATIAREAAAREADSRKTEEWDMTIGEGGIGVHIGEAGPQAPTIKPHSWMLSSSEMHSEHSMKDADTHVIPGTVEEGDDTELNDDIHATHGLD